MNETMKINKAPSSHWELLRATAEWAQTTERRNIEINKETLFWAIEELSKWQLVKGQDLDLPDLFEADEQQPINEEEPL